MADTTEREAALAPWTEAQPRTSDLERLCRSVLLDLIKKWRGPAFVDLPASQNLREGDVGLDSLELLEAVGELNRRFALHTTGIEDHLLMSPSIGAWASLIRKHFELAGPDSELVFASSGSQGVPVYVPHLMSSLTSEVSGFAADLFGRRDIDPNAILPYAGPPCDASQPAATTDQASTTETRDRADISEEIAKDTDGGVRIVSLVAPQHIFGFLFSVMLPAMLRCEVVDLCRSAPGRLHATLKPGDVIVATPHQLELALNAAPLVTLPKDVRAILSGAAVPNSLWDRAADTGLPLVEVYGSTQTAGIGWRQAGGACFALCSDIERGTSGNPQAQNACDALHRRGRALDIQDTLIWQDARHFRLGPRHDSNVQVGGINVSPDAVARLLQAHPLVTSASVRLDAASGRLKAFVVPEVDAPQPAEIERRLRKYAAGKLRDAERPQAYTLGAELPLSVMGKPADW